MRVLQLIDSLDAGGAERIAVNYANALNNDNCTSFLCATRKEGLLKSEIKNLANYFFLEKMTSIDIRALFRLRRFLINNKISILHAHATSYFLSLIHI